MAEIRLPKRSFSEIPDLAKAKSKDRQAVRAEIGVSRETLDKMIEGEFGPNALPESILKKLGRSIGDSLTDFIPRWRKIESLFEYPYSTRSIPVTREIITEIPAQLRDGILIDTVDHYIRERDRENSKHNDYYKDILPEIEPNSDLARKILTFERKMSIEVNAAREDRDYEKSYARPGVDHDPDAWPKMRHAHIARLGQEAALTDEERETLIAAILNYKDEDYGEDEAEYRHLSISFHRFYGEGWLARYRSNGDDTFDINAPLWEDDGLPFWRPEFGLHDEPLDSRNYGLFSILAGVRNYDGTEPIAEPKGVPKNASPEYRRLVERWAGDGHSHSYLNLREILDYDLDGDAPSSGVVTADQYEHMKERGWPDDNYIEPEPATWSGSISGQGIVTFTPEGYEKWVEVGRPYLKQPEPASIFAPDIDVTPEMIPEMDPRAAALSAAPVFSGVRDGIEMASSGKVDLWKDVYGWSDEQIEQAEKSPGLLSDTRYAYNGVRPHVRVSWLRKRHQDVGSEFMKMVEIFKSLVEEHNLTNEDVRVVFFFDN